MLTQNYVTFTLFKQKLASAKKNIFYEKYFPFYVQLQIRRYAL
jgi:hypothetical protein